MKNICVFLMFVLSVCGGFSSYATTDIAADAESSECVEDITGTYSGDANFKAKWTPNNIQLRWYNGYNGTQITPTNTSANTCNYGGALTIPNNPPERIGYIFDGWKVRTTYDFSTLDTTRVGAERWSIGPDSCWHGSGGGGAVSVSCDSYAEFGELEQQEWKVHFSWGDIYGSSYCSAKYGNNSDYIWPAESSSSWLATYDQLERASGNNRVCWCQATGYKPIGENKIYKPESGLSGGWVYHTNYGPGHYCAVNCSKECAQGTQYYSDFRRALFVGDGN